MLAVFLFFLSGLSQFRFLFAEDSGLPCLFLLYVLCLYPLLFLYTVFFPAFCSEAVFFSTQARSLPLFIGDSFCVSIVGDFMMMTEGWWNLRRDLGGIGGWYFDGIDVQQL